MPNFLTWLSRKRFPYDPLIVIQISKNRLISNVCEFQKLAPKGQVAPVLKSNAYGHGLLETATILEHFRHGGHTNSISDNAAAIPFFVVDSFFEAVALRAKGIHTPLLIIGYTRPETILSCRLSHISFTIGSLESLREIESVEHQISIHLKIDTGMRRQGILPDEVDSAMSILTNNTYIRLHGICTHLCDADNEDSSFTDSQIHIWNKIAARIKSQIATLRFIHVSATDGHRYSGQIDSNVSRLGIGLYGLIDGSVFSPKLNLQPVMEMKSIITGIKKLHRNETVGYGNTFRTDRDMTIATIPVGYFEGIDRRLSNAGVIQTGHEMVPCPIIGRVSMNITTIDVSRTNGISPPLGEGTPVTVISNDPTAGNSIKSIADKCSTITYEIAVHIPAHLKRKIVD